MDILDVNSWLVLKILPSPVNSIVGKCPRSAFTHHVRYFLEHVCQASWKTVGSQDVKYTKKIWELNFLTLNLCYADSLQQLMIRCINSSTYKLKSEYSSSSFDLRTVIFPSPVNKCKKIVVTLYEILRPNHIARN